MESSDPILSALIGFALLSMLFGLEGTRQLMKAMPHVRPGVSRAVAATAVKRPFRKQPLDALFLPEGMPAAQRGFAWGRAQYVLMALALIMLLVNAARAHASDPQADRLVARLDEFRVTGDGPGESLPAGWRHDGFGLMKWADATVAHGWYLAELATRRALVVRDGGDTAAVDAELALALGALERLDRVAETGFPEPCTSAEALNGFFVRDDVPADFGARFDGIPFIQSDWTDPSVYLKEMSQDQVHHLLLGLAMVKRFVPADVTVDGRALSPWAVELGLRILEWVEHDGWRIRNPACDDKLVERGDSATQVATGFAAVYRFLTDGAADLPSATQWDDVWALLAAPPPGNPAYLNRDNLHMTSVTAAVGHGYGDDTLPVLVALTTPDEWVAYPLIDVALHGDVPGWQEHRDALLALARQQLDELPSDGEPYGPGEGETAVHGWTSWHRYIRPIEQAYQGAANRDGQRYSGLDWLVLHHLVALVQDVGQDDDTDTTGPVDGCGCAHGASPGLGLVGLAAVAVARRRRRTRE